LISLRFLNRNRLCPCSSDGRAIDLKSTDPK
jgi:hypothetical protein